MGTFAVTQTACGSWTQAKMYYDIIFDGNLSCVAYTGTGTTSSPTYIDQSGSSATVVWHGQSRVRVQYTPYSGNQTGPSHGQDIRALHVPRVRTEVGVSQAAGRLAALRRLRSKHAGAWASPRHNCLYPRRQPLAELARDSRKKWLRIGAMMDCVDPHGVGPHYDHEGDRRNGIANLPTRKHPGTYHYDLGSDYKSVHQPQCSGESDRTYYCRP